MKQKQPLVTVSFPVYNGEKYIEASLRSALCQTYDNIEFLIVDDRGSEESMIIVREILAKSDRNYNIISHQVNLGQGFVRNTSIDNANGQYIFFMDSDDLLTSDCISSFIDSTYKYQVDFVCASSNYIKNESQGIHMYYKEERMYDDKLIIDRIYEDSVFVSPYMWNKLYRLSFLKENNIYCTHSYIEDFHFTFKVFLSAKSCVLLPHVTYNYVIHSDSTTRTKIAKGISKETANIAVEIVESQYKIIEKLASKVSREKSLLDTLGFGIMYLYRIYESKLLTKTDFYNAARRIFLFPKFYPVAYDKFSNFERNKHIYYRLFQLLPFFLKLEIIKVMNFPHYKKKGI